MIQYDVCCRWITYASYQVEDICNLLTLFIIGGHQILSNAFSASVEMIFFFPLTVVDHIDFWMVLEPFQFSCSVVSNSLRPHRNRLCYIQTQNPFIKCAHIPLTKCWAYLIKIQDIPRVVPSDKIQSLGKLHELGL